MLTTVVAVVTAVRENPTVLRVILPPFVLGPPLILSFHRPQRSSQLLRILFGINGVLYFTAAAMPNDSVVFTFLLGLLLLTLPGTAMVVTVNMLQWRFEKSKAAKDMD